MTCRLPRRQPNARDAPCCEVPPGGGSPRLRPCPQGSLPHQTRPAASPQSACGPVQRPRVERPDASIHLESLSSRAHAWRAPDADRYATSALARLHTRRQRRCSGSACAKRCRVVVTAKPTSRLSTSPAFPVCPPCRARQPRAAAPLVRHSGLRAAKHKFRRAKHTGGSSVARFPSCMQDAVTPPAAAGIREGTFCSGFRPNPSRPDGTIQESVEPVPRK
jgi:hypothetical protein